MTSPDFPIPAKMAKRGAHAGPVRVELRTFSPEEIRQFNAEHRYGTAAWDEDAELLANRIRLLKHVGSISISLDQLKRWASHPR